MTSYQYTVREINYSRKWAAENPELFTASILELTEQHPAEFWAFTIVPTKGFLLVTATLKKD
jgi:hypothetical protein